jgi:hypothetical protein
VGVRRYLAWALYRRLRWGQRWRRPHHFALFRSLCDGKGREPTTSAIESESARYVEVGVRLIWFGDFKELLGLIHLIQ